MYRPCLFDLFGGMLLGYALLFYQRIGDHRCLNLFGRETLSGRISQLNNGIACVDSFESRVTDLGIAEIGAK